MTLQCVNAPVYLLTELPMARTIFSPLETFIQFNETATDAKYIDSYIPSDYNGYAYL